MYGMSQTSDPKARFTDRVEDYAKYRPDYPSALIEYLQMVAGLSSLSIVADVGSGTGIFSKQLLQVGCVVYGVEPNAAMRIAAERELSAFPTFFSLEGSAEATGLADKTADLITVAQAFHWFDIEKTREEFRRCLKSTGRVALVWNTRRKDGTEFLVGYEQLLKTFGTDYEHVRHDGPSKREQTTRFFEGNAIQRSQFPHFQEVDWDGLKGRLTSSSYVPNNDDPKFPAMIAALKELFRKHEKNGHVRIEYLTEAHVGSFFAV